MQQLKLWLRFNATFSLTTGLSLVLFESWWQPVLGISEPYLLAGLGYNLLFFAGFVALTSSKWLHQSKLVLSITALDLGWVLGSIGLFIWQPTGLTTAAYWIIALVALMVDLFAMQQYRYWKQMQVAAG